ncbi:hypothetical protein EE612_003435 [Oryza sativa]|nr:hypothetical protein EE612_003435 [Oryza sativa]
MAMVHAASPEMKRPQTAQTVWWWQAIPPKKKFLNISSGSNSSS